MATSPTSGPGGGAAAPITRETFNGSQVLIANNGGANLAWNFSNGPSTLLDRSTLALPTVIVAGVYALAVEVDSDPMTPGGCYEVTLHMDATGEDATVTARSPAAVGVAAAAQPQIVVSATYYIPAGGVVKVALTNKDGANAVNFALGNAVLQRLS